MVFFEAPHRVAATLADMAEMFGADRPAALCRELTKTYEEVRREPLGDLARRAADHEVLGEITLVIAGRPATPPDAQDVDRLAAEVVRRAASGERLKDAAAAVAATSGLSRNLLYEAALAVRGR
jgi:16S rRNA (cytidine1402-2'-O)-methyltransferase